MIPEIQQAYNKAFTPDKYEALLKDSFDVLGEERVFRVAETPLFVPAYLRDRLVEAGESIIEVITRPDFKDLSKDAIPPSLEVPNEDQHTGMLAIDFAICKDENGMLEPQLIEMQGFPSLMAYQDYTAKVYRKHFPVPDDFTPYFNGLSSETYLQLLGECLLNGHEPKHVVLMDLHPEKQKTRVDFAVTEKQFGIKAVCPTKMILRENKLYYQLNGEEVEIKRIYNRLIFDELQANPDIKLPFSLQEPINVEWVTHPNWFFRISKFTMPFLNHRFVPKTWFLEELPEIPEDLENWVLKPLFSFSGMGVKFNVTKADIEALTERKGWILQRKVQYEPVIQAPNGMVKCEIRLLYLWKPEWERPKLCINLGRMSKGVMIGVRYNAEQDWVGGNIAFFPAQ